MNTIILLSCASKKRETKSKAKHMYTSALFTKSLEYSNQIQPNKNNIYILSAKHGLLKLDHEIDPYDLSLNSMSSVSVKEWAKRVLDQLETICIIKETNFVILAGQRYRKYLIPSFTFYEIPLEGLGIGKQLKKLNELIK